MYPFISKIRIHFSFLTLSLLRPVQNFKEMAADSLGSWVTLHCIIPRRVWLPPVRLTRQGMLPGESCFYTFLHLLHSIFFPFVVPSSFSFLFSSILDIFLIILFIFQFFPSFLCSLFHSSLLHASFFLYFFLISFWYSLLWKSNYFLAQKRNESLLLCIKKKQCI